MRIHPMRFIVSIWILCAAGMCVAAADDIITVSPEKPVWGETLEVRYALDHPQSVFEPGDKVYSVYFIYHDKGAAQKYVELKPEGNSLRGEIRVEEGTSFYTFYFTSMDRADTKSNKSLMVYELEGRPARGAYHMAMLQLASKDDYSDYFEKERQAYPDNYHVFRDRWFMAGAYDKENQTSIVEEDMKVLNDIREESPSLLYARNYGYLILGREAESLELLRRLVKDYSESHFAGYAISDYDYQVFSRQWKGDGVTEAAELKKMLCAAEPDSVFSRRQAQMLLQDLEFDQDKLDSILRSWVMDEPDNPSPHFLMAQNLLERKNEAPSAEGEIQVALTLLLKGQMRFYMDIYGKMMEIFLNRYFKLGSDIALALGKTGSALAYNLAAQAVQKEARPDMKAAEGDIWVKLERPAQAEKAYLEALRLGDKTVREKLKDLYVAGRRTDEGFEEDLAEKLKKPAPSPKKDEKTPAPSFEMKTLDGETLRLSDLKGKVVVLNFWFVGCAPCRVEIPGLNELVEEYGDRNVVFIAFALDKADALREFLKKKTFNYRIVPEGEFAVKPYDISLFPTHILIDKEGNIAYRLTGGSPDRHEQLRPLIDNLLR